MPSHLNNSLHPPVCGNFSIYAQSDGLLLQFILSEYLAAYPEVQAMGSLYADLAGHLLYEKLDDERLSCLANGLASLIGGVVEETLPLPWTRSHGALGKLKHYCQLYQCPDAELASIVADLQTATSKSFHAVLLARELVVQIRSAACEQRRRTDSSTLARMLERLSASMSQGAKQLAILLSRYNRNENILYFLLRRNAEVTELFHPGFFLELIAPQDVQWISKFLSERYQARGFDHVVPLIQQQLRGMQ